MKDVAYRGYYVFRPEVFEPDSVGAPPSVVIQIDDLKHYDRFILFELPPELVARVWNDFGPYYMSVNSRFGFRWSDPNKFSSNFDHLCNDSLLCSQMQKLDRGPRN